MSKEFDPEINCHNCRTAVIGKQEIMLCGPCIAIKTIDEEEAYEVVTLDRVKFIKNDEVREINDTREIKDHWDLGFGGMGTWIETYDTEPKVGDKLEFYGTGKFFSIRGIRIAGKVARYQTPLEHEEKVAKDRQERQVEKETGYLDQKEEYIKRVATLPESFQRRIERFQKSNPEFNRDYLMYELMCLEDAVILRKGLKEKEISWNQWKEMEHKEQMAIEKELEMDDGHSGNSHGFMVQMAYLLDQEPRDIVVGMHGSISPLVGCEEFGCEPGYEIPEEGSEFSWQW